MKITVHEKFKPEPLLGKDWFNVLAKGCNIVKELNYKYWISAGTLLGLHRDGNVIPHDTDLDIEIQILENVDELGLISRFGEQGFVLIRSMYDDDKNIVQLAFIEKYSNIIFDIYFFKQSGDQLISKTDCGLLFYNINNFINLTSININGFDFPCPEPNQYCLDRYGVDWNVPKKNKQAWALDANNIKR